ncbi:hypothetical protein A2V61_00625 [Candidatus Woesebacteria bacterium RBG_19FT_COMBO_47_8]|uniref:Uncharacterized protein n=1 Tax=Candidatus Woesebacteria bacterium RBG_13_46_13 TaxID=1802479 RepID=A0A1F7X490_9BACT|nr:MAG: hypothetical protein A2Y68_00495 [Candidatus Woesebacteria bacterium RBG_13_46_13]OGM17696.1 MAG: hypothetical protein A2V61_00625 [Candidatus Woesebacteria bacterium RBG_19FT_COMBO_47_8]HJX59393.1 hypothetical protein [Patescibacteria group bacterium]
MSAKRKKALPLLLVFLVLIPALIVLFALLKLAKPNNRVVYIKMQVSQGLWWSVTSRPDAYFLRAIAKDDTEYSLLGQPVAQIASVRYYPSFDKTRPDNKYDIFLTVKLSASYNDKSQKYSFKRSSLVVGTPIEIETNKTLITGTIMEISKEPFNDEYVEKTVYLTKKYAYPWEYDAIKIGDKYFDGENVVFEVVSKNQKATSVIENDYYGNFNAGTLDSVRYISVKAKIKALKRDGAFYFGELKLLNSGSFLEIWTPNFNFQDFVIGSIQ